VALGFLALPVFGQPDTPTAPNAQVLGVAESVLSYCATRDPTAAATLRERIKMIVQGASPQQLTKLRASDEYRSAYDSVVEFVSKVDEHNAKNFCSETLAAPK
jgi:hypothetical protein